LCVTEKRYEDADPSNDSPKGPLGGLLSYLRSEVKECTKSKFIDRYYRQYVIKLEIKRSR
jgi:hypothetical protein